jgi:hypothetical protein
METLYLPLCERRYVVINKGKIVLITYNGKFARKLAAVFSLYDLSEEFMLRVNR